MSEATHPSAPGKRLGLGGFVLAGSVLPAALVLLPTCPVLAVCLLPTAGALAVDRSRERHLALTVGLLNLAGALPAVAALWEGGQTFAGAGRVLANLLLWLADYGAAGLGWLIFMMAPPLAKAYFTYIGQSPKESLSRRQAQLVETWSEEVAKGQGAAAEEDAT